MIAISCRSLAYSSALLVLWGCSTTLPMGPGVRVMPAPGKHYEVFAEEDRICRQYAEQSIGLAPGKTAAKNAAGSAATGVGSRNEGTLAIEREIAFAGAEQGSDATRDAQLRYDITYQQCMYAKGNQVPGYPLQQIPPPPPSGGNHKAVLG